MLKNKIFICAIHYFIFSARYLVSLDLGNYGHTFPIIEKNMITLLQERLSNLEEGQLENIQQFREIDFDKLSNPDLTKTLSLRVFFYDPSLTLLEDIKDHEGKIIVEKGTCVNPLKYGPLIQNLAFFDAKDPTQVEWASNLSNVKWILVSGDLFELEEKHDRPVYFDQKGYLTKKLGIKHVPALVIQEGELLKITEIPLEASSK